MKTSKFQIGDEVVIINTDHGFTNFHSLLGHKGIIVRLNDRLNNRPDPFPYVISGTSMYFRDGDLILAKDYKCKYQKLVAKAKASFQKR